MVLEPPLNQTEVLQKHFSFGSCSWAGLWLSRGSESLEKALPKKLGYSMKAFLEMTVLSVSILPQFLVLLDEEA